MVQYTLIIICALIQATVVIVNILINKKIKNSLSTEFHLFIEGTNLTRKRIKKHFILSILHSILAVLNFISIHFILNLNLNIFSYLIILSFFFIGILLSILSFKHQTDTCNTLISTPQWRALPISYVLY